MSRAPRKKSVVLDIPIPITSTAKPTTWANLLSEATTSSSGNDQYQRARRASVLENQSTRAQSGPSGRRLTWAGPSAKGAGQSQLFLEIISATKPHDQTAILRYHRQLLSDPSSIYALLKDESSRDLFLVSFQIFAKNIVDFFQKLKNAFQTSPRQNSAITTALLDGVVRELFLPENGDLFQHGEMLDLITISLQSYTLCQNPPGSITKLLLQITQIPRETFLLERLVCDPLCGTILAGLLNGETSRIYVSVFETAEGLLADWTKRLIKLSEKCKFDHNISTTIEKWKAIEVINEMYPPSAAASSFTGAKDTRTGGHRRFSTDEKARGNNSRRLSTDVQPLSIPPHIELLFTQTLEYPFLPKTLAAARTLAPQLRDEKGPEIFNAVLVSFPCSVCQKLVASKNGHSTYGNKYLEEQTDSFESNEETVVDSNQIQRGEMRNLGIWRIVLSKQAMKDLSDAKKSGTFEIVETKLKELASGNWEGRKALTKKHVNSEFPVAIRKVVYGENGRIIWHVHVAFDEDTQRASQVILIWRIGNHKDVIKSGPVIARNQKTFGKEFIDACTLRIHEPNSGTALPQTFGTEVLDQEHITATLTRDESLDLHNAIITGKFYTLSQTVLDAILATGSNAEFPFDVAHEEVEIIRQATSASFILGRSGTGKTTCLVFKLLSNFLTSRISGRNKPLRQIFITRSEILAGKLNGYIHRLIDCQLGRFDGMSGETGPEILKEKDEDADALDFWALKEEDFPLVCTFDKLLAMVERSIKIGERKFLNESGAYGSKIPAAVSKTSNSILRMSQAVEFETFRRDYWERIPIYGRKNIPVDLVFSEIMGIIKGSISSLSGLKALTREEYIGKSCRLAPLFTSEAERHQVYSLYESYEKMKAEYRDWDGVDRARDVFLQMKNSPHIVSQLKDVMEELYVDEIQDQRLLEIELLFSLVKYPRGIHLAGDSAQCISRDSTFRLSDLKALFFEVFQGTAKATNQESLAKPREFRLAQNYRSHQGIIALGALIIECLWNGFPDLIDKLCPEVGKYSGPKPTFFAGFKAEEILMTQSFGIVDLYDQLADFGADQVILVRDEDVQKDIHARIGSEVLILTVLQSKGMEFEDVVLLNFFSASGYSTHYRVMDRLIDGKYGDFDSKRHSVLCAELKTLYVAVTRCRANLRIIEEDQIVADPIISLWTEKVPVSLVDLVRPGAPDAEEKIKALRSGSSGNPELWQKNGQQLMLKKLYKQALFCFQKCEHVQLQTIAKAHLSRQDAESLATKKGALFSQEQVRALYRESAILFEQADYPLEASKSYEIAHLFNEAGNMWERRSRLDKAAPLYELAGEHMNASILYDQLGDFSTAIMVLRRGELYDELVEYLERRQHVLDPLLYQRCAKLCNHFAHQGKLKPTHKSRSLKLLGSDLKIELFYRQRGYKEDLLQLFQEKNRLNSAFYYLVSIGQFEDAILLAPFHELSTHVSPKEILEIVQLLLISDLRKSKDGTPPVYANKSNRHTRPGMDLLWDALYRRLKNQTKIERHIIDSDLKVDGFAPALNYVDFIALERMDDILQRVNSMDLLPYSSVSIGLEMVRDLINSTSKKVPEKLVRYMGAYKQPSRSTYSLLLNSPLGDGHGKRLHRRLTEDMLFTLSRKWFANMVMEAAYAMLQKAIRLWDQIKPGNRCTQQAIKGICTKGASYASATTATGMTSMRCSYNHSNLRIEDFQQLFTQIHELSKTTARLGFVWGRLGDVLNHDIMESFRRRQRRWLEALLTELTFVSAIRQDPVAIMESHVHYTAKDRDKYDQYRYLRNDLEKFVVKIHAKEDFNSRNNFSQLLEQIQRAQNLGYHPARVVRWHLHGICRSSLRWGGPRHFKLFLDRPCLEGRYFKNVDLPSLKYFLQTIKSLSPNQFSALHSILSLFERISTYLLLLHAGSEEIILATSWVKLHLPSVLPAYEAAKKASWLSYFTTNTLPMESEEVILGIVECLLDIATLSNDNLQFSYGGNRTTYIPPALLLRRCFDIIHICMLNVLTSAQPTAKSLDLWDRVKYALNYSVHLARFRLGIQQPRSSDFGGIFDSYVGSFALYGGKESLCILQTSPKNGLRAYKTLLERHHVPTLVFKEEVSAISKRANPRDNAATQNTSEESEEILWKEEEKKAALTIFRIWKENWPRHQKRLEFKTSSLGRATAEIDKVCTDLEAIDEIGYYKSVIDAIWMYGPRAYQDIMFADSAFLETSDCYQSFFSTLEGSGYTDEELEEVEELFEEVQKHGEIIAKFKKGFTVGGILNCWNEWKTQGEMSLGVRWTLKRLLSLWREKVNSLPEEFERLRDNRFVRSVDI